MPANVRTDLASEAHRLWKCSLGKTSAMSGVRAEESVLFDMPVTAVEITSTEGAQALGKPPGLYYTLKLPGRFDRGAEAFENAVDAVAELIRRCMPERRGGSFLVAALGNPDITPDALGSLAAECVIVTRHLKSTLPEEFAAFSSAALCRTGVLGTTGIESSCQIQLLCRELKPDCVIAIDALAGSELGGLCRSVQICSSGIAPGSGVGNDRQALDRDFLGVPVVALGMPTVMDARSLLSSDGLDDLFVTPRSIDSLVRAAARLIGYGINMALHEGLTVADMDALLG